MGPEMPLLAGARGLWVPGGHQPSTRALPRQVQVVMCGRSVGQRLVPTAHPWGSKSLGAREQSPH